VLFDQLLELAVADFGDLAFSAGPNHRRTCWFGGEEADLAEKVTTVEITDHHLLALLLFECDSHRAFAEIVERIARVALLDDGGVFRVTTTVTLGEKLIQPRNGWLESTADAERSGGVSL
jgi:hypothetical protein